MVNSLQDNLTDKQNQSCLCPNKATSPNYTSTRQLISLFKADRKLSVLQKINLGFQFSINYRMFVKLQI